MVNIVSRRCSPSPTGPSPGPSPTATAEADADADAEEVDIPPAGTMFGSSKILPKETPKTPTPREVEE